MSKKKTIIKNMSRVMSSNTPLVYNAENKLKSLRAGIRLEVALGNIKASHIHAYAC